MRAKLIPILVMATVLFGGCESHPPRHGEVVVRDRDTLPPGLAWRELPPELERRLSRLPDGYIRVIVGSDIVLMDRRTRVVLDILYDIALD